MWGTRILLFLHVAGAIVGMGPSVILGLIGARAAKEPEHAGFAMRLSNVIGERWVAIGAAAQGITGLILIFVSDWDFFANEWLWISVLLYVTAFTLSLTVMSPTSRRLVQMTAAPMPAGAAPNPEIMALGAKAQKVGMILGLIFITIIFLMVTKPGLG